MPKKTKKLEDAQPPPVIGAETTYTGTAHTWATGLKVRITAVHKNHHKPGANIDNENECPIIWDNEDLARAGGVMAHDLIEFVPWVIEEGRYSFVSSDARVSELAMFEQPVKSAEGAIRDSIRLHGGKLPAILKAQGYTLMSVPGDDERGTKTQWFAVLLRT